MALSRVKNISVCILFSAAFSFVNATNNSTEQCFTTAPVSSRLPRPRSTASTFCSNLRDSCPPGLFCVNGSCKCGVFPSNRIVCDGTSVVALKYLCVTFDAERELIVAGSCEHIRRLKTDVKGAMVSDTLYHTVPANVTLLDDVMCNPMQRTGVLCGRCLPDHYPLAYSYNMTCIKCPNVRWNWVRYIMAAYLPLTLFFLMILFCRVNTTSSYLFPVVYCCQTMSLPLNLRNVIKLVSTGANPWYFVTAKVFFSLYGIWNLDFFRLYYTDLCLGIDVLPTLSLDYAIAVYPLLLVYISYVLIAMYSNNYRLVTLLWRPFRALFSLCRRNWDIRTSVIDSFATFFFLSYVKFISVSFDLLTPTVLYQLYPDHYNYTIRLYSAPDLEYFGREHLPYAVVAIAVLCVIVIMPVCIFALYPFLFFQKLLNLLHIRWHILHTFVDSYYGCYKDGTLGTRDCRWCVCVFFVLRLFQHVLYFTPNKEVYNIFITLILVVLITLVATLQPFKSSLTHYNFINIIFLQLLCFISVVVLSISVTLMICPELLYFFLPLLALLSLLPLLYFVVASLFWIHKRKRCSVNILQRWRAHRLGYSDAEDCSIRILPDRIENPGAYHTKNMSNFSSPNI